MPHDGSQRVAVATALHASEEALRERLAKAVARAVPRRRAWKFWQQAADDGACGGAVQSILDALLRGIIAHVETTGATELVLPYDELVSVYLVGAGRKVTSKSLQTLFSRYFGGRRAKVWSSVGLGNGLTCDGVLVSGGPGRPKDGAPGRRGLRIILRRGNDELQLPCTMTDTSEHPFVQEVAKKRAEWESQEGYREALQRAEEEAKVVGRLDHVHVLHGLRLEIERLPRLLLAVLIILGVAGLSAAAVWVWHSVRAYIVDAPVSPPQPPILDAPRVPGVLTQTQRLEDREFRAVLEIYRDGEYRQHFRLAKLRFARESRDATVRWKWTFRDHGEVVGSLITDEPAASFTYPRPAVGASRVVSVAPETSYQFRSGYRAVAHGMFIVEHPVTHEPLTEPVHEAVTLFRTDHGVFRQFNRFVGYAPSGAPEYSVSVVVPPLFTSGGRFDLGMSIQLPLLGVQADPTTPHGVWIAIICADDDTLCQEPLQVAFGDGVVDLQPSPALDAILVDLPRDYRQLPVLFTDHAYRAPGTYTVVVTGMLPTGREELVRRTITVP